MIPRLRVCGFYLLMSFFFFFFIQSCRVVESLECQFYFIFPPVVTRPGDFGWHCFWFYDPFSNSMRPFFKLRFALWACDTVASRHFDVQNQQTFALLVKKKSHPSKMAVKLVEFEAWSYFRQTDSRGQMSSEVVGLHSSQQKQQGCFVPIITLSETLLHLLMRCVFSNCHRTKIESTISC